MAVKNAAQFVVIGDTRDIDRRDAHPATSGFLDQAIGFQKYHRLLDGLARNAQSDGQLFLDQVLARCQPTIENFVKDRAIDAVGQIGLCGEWLHDHEL